MTMIDRAELAALQAFITKLSDTSAAFAAAANVGGMETAGGLVSYLARFPEHLEMFLSGGVFALPPDWCVQGCLTHHAINGKVTHPQTARDARIIKGLERDQCTGTPHD